MEGISQQYERDLGDVKDLKRYLRDRTKDIYSINIRERETSFNMEGTKLDLLEA